MQEDEMEAMTIDKMGRVYPSGNGNGLGIDLECHPLWKWEQGMSRNRNAINLNDPVTVALIAQQARRLMESQFTAEAGGYEAVREGYRWNKGRYAHSEIPLHVVPVAAGWKIRDLRDYDEATDRVAAIAWATEGQAWAAAWLVAAEVSIEIEGMDKVRARIGVTHAIDEILPVPLFVKQTNELPCF
jgi:hypothetical protein